MVPERKLRIHGGRDSGVLPEPLARVQMLASQKFGGRHAAAAFALKFGDQKAALAARDPDAFAIRGENHPGIIEGRWVGGFRPGLGAPDFQQAR